ncbi:hypothetical protein B0H14DRAFT_2577061 [Mycena olivaceomarginata]|nr:hypothetical protein B0H14DRAFT_2577061 [Mycena olivaceomarginata]
MYGCGKGLRRCRCCCAAVCGSAAQQTSGPRPRPNPYSSEALVLVLLLDCILSACEAPTGPQVRTSVRDENSQVKGGKVRRVCKGNASGVGGTAYAEMRPVTCMERRKRQVARRGRDGTGSGV